MARGCARKEENMDAALKAKLINIVDENMEELRAIRTYLYDNPEVGGEEKKASRFLTKKLEEHGFTVTRNLIDIPYSFQAVYDSGKAGPAIGLMCEYDALPLMGHGCGHNLIAAASAGAAFALQAAADEVGGKIIVFGTPAEECFACKGPMAEAGVFAEADVAMMVHPSPTNRSSGKTTALDAWQIDFFGKAAHAGTAPEEGINALDAAVHFYTLVGFEKQYLKNTNIYGVFAAAGEKCSVIPDYAAVKYLVRGESVRELNKIRNMFQRCAYAAAGAVGAQCKIWRNEPPNKNLVTNSTLSDVFNRHYQALGGGEMPHTDSPGSTDMGDASYVIPAIHPWVGLDCPQLSLHSEAFARQTVTEAGDRMLRLSAQALALTGAEVLSDEKLLKAIKREFQEFRETVSAAD